MSATIWVCELHGDDVVITYTEVGNKCPICELQKDKDALERRVAYLEEKQEHE